MFEKLQTGEKIHDAPGQPCTCLPGNFGVNIGMMQYAGWTDSYNFEYK